VAAPSIDKEVLSASISAGVVNLAGTGEPQSVVQVLVGGRVLGQATVDAQGR
jgi:hypothetical protein